VRPLDAGAGREVLLPDPAHGLGQDVERSQRARDRAARRDDGQPEGDHGRGQGGHLQPARHRLRVLALPHHRRLVHVENAVGGLLEAEEAGLELLEVHLGRPRGRGGGEGGDAGLIVLPTLAQLGRRLLLPGLGDVAFLHPQLGFEGATVVVDLRPRFLRVAGHDEQDRAVEPFRRLLHALGGQHAAVVGGEDVLGGGAEGAQRLQGQRPHHEDGQDERKLGQEQPGAQGHGSLSSSSSVETM
jgi:hypothetical protein